MRRRSSCGMAAGAVEEAGICGTLLGVDERAQFHDYTTHLGVGDLLAFWTDGVTERRQLPACCSASSGSRR